MFNSAVVELNLFLLRRMVGKKDANNVSAKLTAIFQLQ